MPRSLLGARPARGCLPACLPAQTEQPPKCQGASSNDSLQNELEHLADKGHGSLPKRLLLHKYVLNIQLAFIHLEQQLRHRLPRALVN